MFLVNKITNIVFTKLPYSDSKHLIALIALSINFDEQYLLLIKQKQTKKIFKKT